ncbi:hypothetical protein ACFR9U_00610 [Halorientalis brevis]|uniref:Small CPxCG-related zinc finger protein n=1 Tax=Halorientalis brevis TaxID=1126241 RepID=A0ABD6C5B4_9EURY|nr:hypothetical protein [Halorientalis brevis]
MSITDKLRGHLDSTPAFACTYCGLTFEQDRLNCPACGCDVRDTR